MPELPEVETIRQDLLPRIVGKTIRDVVIRRPKIVRVDKKIFLWSVIGQSVTDIQRRGKLLIAPLSNALQYILIHLKMTGQLIYRSEAEIIAGGHSFSTMDFDLPNQYTHVSFQLNDDSFLHFNDMRQFGYIDLVDSTQLEKILNVYGIEPLTKDFTLEAFTKLFKQRTAPTKAVLLNQERIAGIGNIYADEICFQAAVRPMRAAKKLTLFEIGRLYKASSAVLKKAIRYRGTTFSSFVDSTGKKGQFTKHLMVYGRTGLECRRCTTGIIQKTVSAGRGTHYCPNCQK